MIYSLIKHYQNNENAYILTNKTGKCKRCQVADSSLLRATELNNLRAEIGRLNSPQILLVALSVARIFEQYVRISGLNLSLQHSKPKLLRLHNLLGLSLQTKDW